MSHTSRLYPGLYAVIKTMWKMWIQLLCACVLYSMGSREQSCPNMGICDVNKSHGRNARFWLVETKFAALWLVTTSCSHYDYSYRKLLGGGSINQLPPPPLLYYDGGINLRVRPRVKRNSFVLKWKRVVSALSPSASKSCGGSHIIVRGCPL